MRSIDQSGFFKILSGQDYEFLINGFSFRMFEDVRIKNSRCSSAHSLKFGNSRFKSVFFSDLELNSNIVFNHCTFETIAIEHSGIQSMQFKNCVIDKLLVSCNKWVNELLLADSQINTLLINDNNKIDQLHIGCDNLLDQAQIMNNGESNANQSRFFLCPERFNDIIVNNLKAAHFELGTFGQFSNLNIDNVTADEVIFKNCFEKSNNVQIGDFKPLSKESSIVKISDSYLNSSIFTNDFLSRKSILIELENSTIDHNSGKFA